MKNTFKIAFMLLSLTFTSSIFSKENPLIYKLKPIPNFMEHVGGYGAIAFTFGAATTATDKSPGDLPYYLMIYGMSATGVAVLSNIVSGAISGNKEIDKKRCIDEYQGFQYVMRSSYILQRIPQNVDIQGVLSQYSCYNCKTDLDKLVAFGKFFAQVDNYAFKTILHKRFNPKKAEAYFKSIELKNDLTKILGDNYTEGNYNMARKILGFALIFHSAK